MYLMNNANSIEKNLIERLHSFFILLPRIDFRSIVEIAILAVLIYIILKWIKTSRAWILIRGVIIIFAIAAIAYLLHFTVILWLLQKGAALALIALVVIFQSEMRQALEHIGKTNIALKMLPFHRTNFKLSDKSIREICKASFSMGKVKTGALIVIKQIESLKDVEETGIEVDGVVTNQLLINIFEKNTPLHDGAVLICDDKVQSATCYLPLTKREVPKEFGTRHRAALGMSENSDAIVVVVSEETGKVSICMDGQLKIIDSEEKLFGIISSINSAENLEERILAFNEEGIKHSEKV